MGWRTARFHVVLAAVLLGGLLVTVGWIAYSLNIHGGQCAAASTTVLATSCEGSVDVVVAVRDIPPGTPLDPLLVNPRDNFRVLALPMDAIVEGAVTSTDQLRGQTTANYIYANEQIVMGRLGEPCPQKPNGVCL